MKQTSPSRLLSGRLIALSVVGAYFAVLLFGGLLNGANMSVLAPDFIAYLPPLTYAIAWVVVTAVLLLYGSISKRFVYAFAWLASVGYALWATVSGGSYTLTFLMCGLVALMTVLVGQAMRAEPAAVKKTKAMGALSETGGKMAVGVTCAVAGGAALFLALASYLSYMSSPVMSTGMYIQMMESLSSGAFFDTTLEFGETVSHFAAHISPIFLVFLPFYAILPSPVTLIVLQVAAVYSAVIPLWLIARRRGLSCTVSAVLCGLFCLFPAVFGGTVGGFHEYALLLPLLMWLIWALESGRRILVWVFAIAALCVRETAAIHVLTLGIYWLIVNRRSLDTANESRSTERRTAWILTGVSAVYFVTAIFALNTFGRGTLITRFDNVTGEYGTFISSFLWELFCNPALVIYELWSEAKLFFVLAMLLPLGCLPLLSRRRAGLVFLFPFLFLNLLADYPYHYNLDFPYTFGITAFLFYLAVIALGELKLRADGGRTRRRVLWLAVCFTLLVGGFRAVDYGPYVAYALTGGAEVDAMDELIGTVDEDASVSVSARLCPQLAARDEVFTLAQKVETDVVVLDLRADWALSTEADFTVAYYEKLGYEVLTFRDGVGAVLSKKSVSPS